MGKYKSSNYSALNSKPRRNLCHSEIEARANEMLKAYKKECDDVENIKKAEYKYQESDLTALVEKLTARNDKLIALENWLLRLGEYARTLPLGHAGGIGQLGSEVSTYSAVTWLVNSVKCILSGCENNDGLWHKPLSDCNGATYFHARKKNDRQTP
jgi:hypothetical protein